MMFKNSVKLLSANFSTVWKLLVYTFVVCSVSFLLLLPVGRNILDAFGSTNFFAQLFNCLSSFNLGTSLFQVFGNFYSLATLFFASVQALFTISIFSGIYSIFILAFVLPFLYNFAELAVGESLYGYMSSLTKISFTGSLFRNAAKSCLYGLVKVLVVLPVNLLICAAVFGVLRLGAVSNEMFYFVPFLVTVVACFALGLKLTLFSGWMPAMIVFECGPFKGLRKGCKAVSRRFLKTLSTASIIIFAIFATNLLFGSFAFIITIPLAFMFVLVFPMIMFFGSQGMRYYVDSDTILAPKKLEEIDSFKKVKDII